jgi:lysophospholipase L1-like esterase
MAECDASLYMLDFAPNCNAELVSERTEKFYRILRDKHPNTPIVFIENPMYPTTVFNMNTKNYIRNKNKALNEVFNGLKAQKEKNIWLIPSDGMIGNDGEATVDGTHFTDLGFLRYAEFLYPKIKKIIGKQ